MNRMDKLRGDTMRRDRDALAATLAALEVAFIAMGRAGANSDLGHPCRKAWEQARAALKAAGRLP